MTVELTLLQPGGLVALAQVLMIDVVLAGDNAVVIGLAAARVPVKLRKKVILRGGRSRYPRGPSGCQSLK